MDPNARELSIEDIQELLRSSDDLGDEKGGSDEGKGAAGGAEGDKGGTADWKAETEKLKSQLEDQKIQVVSLIGEVLRNQRAALGPGPAEVKPPEGVTPEQWRLIQQVPELAPALLRRDLGPDLDARDRKVEERILDQLQRRELGDRLGKVLTQHYDEEIRDPNSPVIRTAQEVRNLIAPLLDPTERNGDRHNQLSVLIAAAMHPEVVTKRTSARMKASEEARQAALSRINAMGGGRGGGPPKEPEIGDEELEVGRRLGLNMDDENVRKRILGGMKSETLRMHGMKGER